MTASDAVPRVLAHGANPGGDAAAEAAHGDRRAPERR